MIPLRDDNPTELRPIVTVTIIVLCLLVFALQLALGNAGFGAMVYRFGFTPAALFGDPVDHAHAGALSPLITIFTSMFLHGGVAHAAGNMLYLWIFGNNVEDAMGHTRFIVFYLVCGAAAAATHAGPSPDSVIPMIGASGAISGILGAYLLLFPRARVLILIPFGLYSRVVWLPALWVLGLWFVLQILSSLLADTSAGGVAWGAHIGGFVAGVLLIPVFKRRGVRLLAPPRHSEYD